MSAGFFRLVSESCCWVSLSCSVVSVVWPCSCSWVTTAADVGTEETMGPLTCLELEALIRSNTALDIYELRGQVPETVVSGETSDISPFVELAWY